jgi:type II secretory pathway component PulJ
VLRREDGHTLVEVLVAAMIGVLILIAIFTLVDTGTKSGALTADRIETISRTRSGMELVRARLRTAVCPPATPTQPALLEAQDARITFYSQVAERPAGAIMTEPPIQRRTLFLQDGQLREEVYDLAPAGNTAMTFAAAPSSTATLADRVQASGGTPVFAYLDDTGAAIADTAQRPAAARVRVRLAGQPRRAESVAAPSDTTVVLRTDDPTDDDMRPEC